MTTKQTAEAYFKGINEKNGWETLIGDEMVFTGPNTKTKGKDAYIQATNRFLMVVKGVHIKQLIAEGENACVLANYDMLSPAGNKLTMDIAEVLTVKNGKITASSIYFDTAAFREFMARGK